VVVNALVVRLVVSGLGPSAQPVHTLPKQRQPQAIKIKLP
jgi:hypothetical protein